MRFGGTGNDESLPGRLWARVREVRRSAPLCAGGRSQDALSDGVAGGSAPGARSGGAWGWLIHPVPPAPRWVRVLSMSSGASMHAMTRNVPPHTLDYHGGWHR